MQVTYIFKGYVSPQESFYTGLEVSDQMNPHIITILGIGSVSFLTAVGSYTFNWYYLKTYHNTRNSILRTFKHCIKIQPGHVIIQSNLLKGLLRKNERRHRMKPENLRSVTKHIRVLSDVPVLGN